jgi:hypothetical protein
MKLLRWLFLLPIASCGFAVLSGCSSGTTITQTPNKPAPAATVYVTSGFPGQIYGFTADSTGVPSAASTINLTGPNSITALAVDPAGNIYAATVTDIREYAAGATGAATPIRTIPFDATSGLSAVFTLAADSAGDIYVGQINYTTMNGSILVFSGTANGSSAPVRVIAGTVTELGLPEDLAVDSTGNLYVLNPNTNSQPSILVFAAGANGNVAPVRTLNGAFLSMAVDSAGDIYTLGFTGISIYTAGASGSATPAQTIASATLGEPAYTGDLAVDSAGYMFYTSNGTQLNNVRAAVPTIFRLAPPLAGSTAVLNSFIPAGWTPSSSTLLLNPMVVH